MNGGSEFPVNWMRLFHRRVRLAAADASRCRAQLTFGHYALVRFARIPQAVFDFAIALRQNCSDDVSAAQNVEISSGLDEDCIPDLEFASRHDAIE